MGHFVSELYFTAKRLWWEKEFELLSEYLKYRIEEYATVEVRRLEFMRVFERTGNLYYEVKGNDLLNYILTFEEWKYWIRYRDKPWDFWNRYIIPKWAPLITKEEWNNTLGFMHLKSRQMRVPNNFPVDVRVPLLLSYLWPK